MKSVNVRNDAMRVFDFRRKRLSAAVLAGLFFGQGATADIYNFGSGQLAPNPNLPGDIINIYGAAYNDPIAGGYLNEGYIYAAPGASLTNRAGANLTNGGFNVWIDNDGNMQAGVSAIDNKGTLINVGAGTVLNNTDGARLGNWNSMSNQGGAALINAGVHVWTDSFGNAIVYQSRLDNGNVLTNTGAGTTLINKDGADLHNGGVLTNENGATLTSAGIHAWIDNAGATQFMSSTLGNEGTLTNAGAGTTLKIEDGGSVFNQNGGTMNNQAGAALLDTGGRVWTDGSGNDQFRGSWLGNQGELTNAGAGTALTVQDGANLHNLVGGNLTNRDGASLTGSGGHAWTDSAGNPQFNSSWIGNDGTITNAGSGTSVTMQDGANLYNSGKLNNQDGAVIVNSGVYNWTDGAGNTQFVSSHIGNKGTLANSGAGTALTLQEGGGLRNFVGGHVINQDGASLKQGGVHSWIDSAGNTQVRSSWIHNEGVLSNSGNGTSLSIHTGANLNNEGALVNQSGASITNSGVHAWTDGDGNAKFFSSHVGNNGALTNTGIGTELTNSDGANMHNSVTLTNQDGAKLSNVGGYVWTDGNGNAQFFGSHIRNEGVLTNAGIGTELTNLDGANLYNGATLTNQDGARLTNAGVHVLADGIYVASTLFNDAKGTLTNAGAGTALYNRDGAGLHNYGFLDNRDGAALIHSGAHAVTDGMGNTQIVGSWFGNGGTINDSGAGTSLTVQEGAFLHNFAQGRITNETGAALAVQNGGSLYNQGALVNQSGASITNGGVREWIDGAGNVQFVGSNIGNDGVLTNVGAGTTLKIEDGANLYNGATLNNQDGARLTNAGGHAWTDGAGNVQFFGSHIGNGGILTNAGAGTELTNRDGASISSGNGSTLLNRDGATLVNAGGQFALGPWFISSDLSNEGGNLVNSGGGTNLFNRDGAHISNWNGATLTNENGAVLTNSGGHLWSAGDGHSQFIESRIDNDGGSLVNAGSGAVLAIRDGASLINDNGGAIENRAGAAIVNAGVHAWTDGAGNVQFVTSRVGNGGTLTNAGAGTTLKIEDGANLYNGATLTNQDGASLTNTGGHVLTDGAFVASTLFNDAKGTLTNAGAGTTLLNLDGAQFHNYGVLNNRDGAGLIHSGAHTVTDGAGNTQIVGSWFGNGGTISNSGAGTSLTVQDGAFLHNFAQGRITNETGAALAVQNGGSLYNQGALVNQSGASITNGGVREWIDGAGNVQFVGSNIGNDGVLTNVGAGTTLKIEDGANLYNGATLNNQDGAALTGAGGHVLTDGAGAVQFVSSGVGNGGTLTNAGAGTRLTVQDGANLNNAYAGTINNQGGASITGSGIYVAADGMGNIQTYSSWLGNYGKWVNADAGTSVNLENGASLHNFGTLTNQNGAALLDTGGRVWTDGSGNDQFRWSWLGNQGELTNAGAGTALTVQDGAGLHNFFGGTLTNQDGATLIGSGVHSWTDGAGNARFDGTWLNNQGTLINAGAGTSFSIQDGANLYNDATLNNQDGARLTNAGVFFWADRVLFGSALGNGGTLTNAGAGTVLVNRDGADIYNWGRLINADGATLINTGAHGVSDGTGNVYLLRSELNNAGVLDNRNGATLINEQGAVLENDSSGVVNNEGTIRNDALIENSGVFLVAASGTVEGTGVLRQYDGILTVDGSLSQSAIYLQGGVLNGTGLVDATLNMSGGRIAPGHSPGSLTINGDFNFSGGILDIEIGGLAPGEFDVLNILGAAHFLGGTIRFDFIDGFLPTAGDMFDFIVAGAIDGLDKVVFAYTGLAPGFEFSTDWDAGVLRFTALNDGSVPEPHVLLLFGPGLSLLLMRRRAKARRIAVSPMARAA